MKNIQTPASKSIGTQERNTQDHEEPFSGFADILTPLLLTNLISSGSLGANVLKGPCAVKPDMLSPYIVTWMTLSLSTMLKKSL
jgi:hypothetical protein